MYGQVEYWNYKQIMEYYSVFKRNEIFIHATTRMSFENTKPSEIKRTQRNKYWMIPLIYRQIAKERLPGAERREE